MRRVSRSQDFNGIEGLYEVLVARIIDRDTDIPRDRIGCFGKHDQSERLALDYPDAEYFLDLTIGLDWLRPKQTNTNEGSLAAPSCSPN